MKEAGQKDEPEKIRTEKAAADTGWNHAPGKRL
jgi:hypothetical protein